METAGIVGTIAGLAAVGLYFLFKKWLGDYFEQ